MPDNFIFFISIFHMQTLKCNFVHRAFLIQFFSAAFIQLHESFLQFTVCFFIFSFLFLPLHICVLYFVLFFSVYYVIYVLVLNFKYILQIFLLLLFVLFSILLFSSVFSNKLCYVKCELKRARMSVFDWLLLL